MISFMYWNNPVEWIGYFNLVCLVYFADKEEGTEELALHN